MCNIILGEMQEYLRPIGGVKTGRRKFRNYKPFWNDELTNLWNIMKT
jgi:hypothetical protein